ncbi:MAG: 50S ribosomal protein L3 [Rickettsiales bacterium]
MRVGLIAKKLGMSSFLDSDGQMTPVTLLKVDSCQVVGAKQHSNGFKLQVGAFNCNSNKIGKSKKGFFAKAKIAPKNKICEFPVSEDAVLEGGQVLDVRHYVKGQYIDVTGISVGKGFAGVMKRHNFSGLRASHGVSVSHRSHGSTGQCQDPGKVFKGKKMAGHMGSRQVTKQNIKIVDIDLENNLIAVKGSVPGHKGGVLMLKDAIKRAVPAEAPYPCFTENQQQNVEVAEQNES